VARRGVVIGGSGFRRRVVTAAWLVLAAGLAVRPAPVSGFTGSVSGGILTINGTGGDDTVIVTCSTGSVKLNGSDPTSGPATCASITSVSADLMGGNDFVNLSMSPVSFPALVSSNVAGGDGDDGLSERAGSTTFAGGRGRDSMTPAEGNDSFGGGPGSDLISMYGSSAGVVLTDSTLSSTMYGTDSLSSVERVSLFSSGGIADATAFSGSVSIQGSGGADTLLGGSGDDWLYGGLGIDNLQGNQGDDQLDPSTGNDSVSGGGGSDLLSVFGTGDATLTDASLTGTGTGVDSLAGIERADLGAGGGASVLDVSAFSGTTVLRGSDFGDQFFGSPQADTIIPYAGDDFVSGGAGPDTFEGRIGPGETGTATNLSFASPLDGTDTLTMIDTFVLLAASGNEVVDASAVTRKVQIYGDDGNDRLLGGSKADSLFGEKGNDRLIGADGNDLLNGGRNSDVCKGGTGKDRYRRCERAT
jgi:Ca2+-binding RTX toxin-like protein